jgi:Zn-dependent protease with chaperone function
VEASASKSLSLFIRIFFCSLFAASALAQDSAPEIPDKFHLDTDAAAQLRPQLMAQSIAPSNRYATGSLVFKRLVEQVAAPARGGHVWQLRIVVDDQLNAFSSPDGTLYVESGLARLAGESSGLWSAILSHEIAHVVRRDWARRYLYQKYLENGGGVGIVLGDPGLPSDSWADTEKLSADMGRFCRQMEIDADREGLVLMAKAGYHPDFVPALHHLLHAQNPSLKTASLYAMHPCWEERDRELSRAYVAASIEFERRWPEWYSSPGGNPPVLVFADAPTVRKTGSRGWQIQIPMRCQNLAGAVEVVLRASAPPEKNAKSQGPPADPLDADHEVRQLTGCTSPRTTVTFTLDGSSPNARTSQWTDVYVLDAWGSVLARADLPRLH